ncbi:MAG TPA: hypothetical protein VM597_10570 [Gemmataceae bacterium]|nr:hypothetical protein [Gemmataceae bacterium]
MHGLIPKHGRVEPGSLRLEDFWTCFRPTVNRDARTARVAFEFQREKRRDGFDRWLKRHYDDVIVDCPPAIAWQVRFFLLVADGYVVPAIPDRLSVRGARYPPVVSVERFGRATRGRPTSGGQPVSGGGEVGTVAPIRRVVWTGLSDTNSGLI